MSAGDILLFSRPTTRANFRRDKFGTVMTALIHLTTRSRWNHVALDIGDGLMVEATSKGVAVNPIGSSDEIRVVSALELEAAPSWKCVPGFSSDLIYGGNDRKDTALVSPGDLAEHFGVPRK